MDYKQRSERNKELLNKGLKTINQVRAEYGLKPMKEGNKRITTFNYKGN